METSPLGFSDVAGRFWQASDGRVYSAGSDAMVAIAPPSALVWPSDASGNQTTASLYALLEPYGLGASLSPSKSEAVLASELVAAASAASLFITQQVVPDQTHQVAYANALAIVGSGAVLPTSDPSKTAFNNMANAFGFGTNPQSFANLSVLVGSASLNLSAILGTLEEAAKTATTATALGSALSAFETAIGALVTSLNGAGLTITIQAPAPIVIVGINA